MDKTIKYTAVVWENPGINMVKTIKQLENYDTPPDKIIVALQHNTKHNVLNLQKILDYTNIPYVIKLAHDEEASGFYRMINTSMLLNKSNFVLIVADPPNIPHNTIREVSKKIDEGMTFHLGVSSNKVYLINKHIYKFCKEVYGRKVFDILVEKNQEDKEECQILNLDTLKIT